MLLKSTWTGFKNHTWLDPTLGQPFLMQSQFWPELRWTLGTIGIRTGIHRPYLPSAVVVLAVVVGLVQPLRKILNKFGNRVAI